MEWPREYQDGLEIAYAPYELSCFLNARIIIGFLSEEETDVSLNYTLNTLDGISSVE